MTESMATVTQVKPTQRICSACFYVQRGSFPDIKSSLEIKEALVAHESIRARFKQCRQDFFKAKQAGKKPRHTKLNLKELLRKAEETYIDFREARASEKSLNH